MVRVLIHAGFHKTGTKSVQAMIDVNRALLAPVARCFLKADFVRLTELAREYSASRDRTVLRALRQAARAFFSAEDGADPRPLLMSAEDLAGQMPGRRDTTRYGAAPEIMAQIAGSARAAFGEETDIAFYFSTRGAESWLASLHWQNLRNTRMTDDLPAFAESHREAAQFRRLLAAIASAAAPARVFTRRLDQVADLPEGPLTPILDLLQVGPDLRAALTVLPPANAMPDDGLRDVFLSLNRSGLSDAVVADAKKHILRLARRTL